MIGLEAIFSRSNMCIHSWTIYNIYCMCDHRRVPELFSFSKRQVAESVSQKRFTTSFISICSTSNWSSQQTQQDILTQPFAQTLYYCITIYTIQQRSSTTSEQGHFGRQAKHTYIKFRHIFIRTSWCGCANALFCFIESAMNIHQRPLPCYQAKAEHDCRQKDTAKANLQELKRGTLAACDPRLSHIVKSLPPPSYNMHTHQLCQSHTSCWLIVRISWLAISHCQDLSLRDFPPQQLYDSKVMSVTRYRHVSLEKLFSFKRFSYFYRSL